MPTSAVIKYFGVLKDSGFGWPYRIIVLCINQFHFESTKERLHHPIAPTISLATHAGPTSPDSDSSGIVRLGQNAQSNRV